MKKNSINSHLALEIFSSESYLVVNKRLLKKYGPNVSIFISNLIDKYTYFREKDKLKDGDWFFQTHEQIMEQTGLSLHEIRACKTLLKRKEVIETKLKGVPPKEWYRIDLQELINTIQEDIKPPKDAETASLTIENTDAYTNKEIIYKERLLCNSATDNTFVIVPNLFDRFWNIYPKKKSKGAALSAWTKICNKKPKERPTWKSVKLAIREQTNTEQWQNPLYIPNASTWLNQSRWLDDPKEMKGWTKKEDQVNEDDYQARLDYERTHPLRGL